MGALLKLILLLYFISLLFSLAVGILRFWIDIFKWHDREKKVKIIKSIDMERGENNGRNDNTEYRGTVDNTGDRTGDNDTGTGDTTGDRTGTGNALIF